MAQRCVFHFLFNKKGCKLVGYGVFISQGVQHWKKVENHCAKVSSFISDILMQGEVRKYVHIPEYISWEAQGGEFKSILARGERLGCRGWMVKQSVSASSVVDFI